MTVLTEWSLDEEIKIRIEELEGPAIPQEIAQELATEIPEDQIQYVLERGLIPLVSAVIRKRRHRAMKGRPTESVRWQVVADSYSSGMMDFLEATVYCGEYKLMAECTYDDLKIAEEELRTEADEAIEMAKRYAAIARVLKTP